MAVTILEAKMNHMVMDFFLSNSWLSPEASHSQGLT